MIRPLPSRLTDYKPRLRAYLAEQAATPFEMGRYDCGAFAGGAIEAMTGVNPHADLAGRYKTMRGALRVLRRMGHEDHVAYTASLLTEIAPSYAAFGDIAVVDGTDGPALGVVTGAHIEIRTSDAGRGLVPLTDATRAFTLP